MEHCTLSSPVLWINHYTHTHTHTIIQRIIIIPTTRNLKLPIKTDRYNPSVIHTLKWRLYLWSKKRNFHSKLCLEVNSSLGSSTVHISCEGKNIFRHYLHLFQKHWSQYWGKHAANQASNVHILWCLWCHGLSSTVLLHPQNQQCLLLHLAGRFCGERDEVFLNKVNMCSRETDDSSPKCVCLGWLGQTLVEFWPN